MAASPDGMEGYSLDELRGRAEASRHSGCILYVAKEGHDAELTIVPVRGQIEAPSGATDISGQSVLRAGRCVVVSRQYEHSSFLLYCERPHSRKGSGAL